MARDIIPDPPGKSMHGAGMVPGVKAGGLIFFSAIRGNAPGSRDYADDTRIQARQALDNLRLLCQGAGITLDDVLKVTLYLHHLDYRTAFHEVWMEVFPKDPPARIAIQVADANAVPGAGAHFALDVIARAP